MLSPARVRPGRYSSDIVSLFGEKGERAPKFSADVLAVAAGLEDERSETAQKMDRWRELTTGNFELRVLEGCEHQELIDNNSKTKEVGKGVAAVLEDLAKQSGVPVVAG